MDRFQHAENAPGNLSEEDDTLRRMDHAARARSASSSGSAQSVSRLSGLFGAWASAELQPTQHTSISQDRHRIVSEPIAVDDTRRSNNIVKPGLDGVRGRILGGEVNHQDSSDSLTKEDISDQLEKMMDLLGMKEGARINMRALDEDKKRVLLIQHQQLHGVDTLRPHRTGPGNRQMPMDAFVHAGERGGGVLSIKRFSIAGWSSNTEDTPKTASPTLSDSESFSSGLSSPVIFNSPPIPSPLLQTATGWTSWFSAGSPAKLSASSISLANKPKDTPAWYIQQISSKRIMQKDLVKHLIALRVRLSTQQLPWIEEFLNRDGVEVLEELLKIVVTKGILR